MRLRSLRIHRLPGIDAPFELSGLRPDVHVLVGPNASGKSSVVRALRAVLYAHEARGTDVSVEATFDHEDGSLHAARTGDTLTWRRDGEPADPPPLPDARFLDCYVVRIEDLGAPGDTERAIEAALERELHGGFDLDEARRQAGVDLKRGHGKDERDALHAAEDEVRAARDAQRRLAEDEASLASLREERHAWRERAREVPHLEAAGTLARARGQEHEADAELAAFPSRMERVRADALDDLDAALARRHDAREAVAQAESEIEAAREAWQATGLPADAPRATDVDAQEAVAGRIRSAEAERDQAERHAREAEVRLREAREALGSPRPDAAPRVDPATLRSLGDDLDRLRQLREREVALDERQRLLAADEGAGSAAALREGRRYAAAWLRARTAPRGAAWHAGTGLSLVAALALAVAAVTVAPWLGALATAVLLGAWLHHRDAGGEESRRDAARRAFADTGLAPPEAWTLGGVTARLEALDAELERAERAARDRAERERVEVERAGVARERAELEDALRARAETLGFDATPLNGSLHRWAHLLQVHDEAAEALRQARADAEARAEAAQRDVRTVRAFLAEYDADPAVEAADAAVLTGALQALKARVSARDEAEAWRRRAVRRRDEAVEKRAAPEEEVRRGFVHFGLVGSETELDDRDEHELRLELRERVRRLERYHALRQTRDEARTRAADAEARLADVPHLRALANGPAEALEARLDDARGAQQKAEDLHERIARIEERIRQAGTERALEAATAHHQAARDALEARYDEALEAEAGAFLFDRMEREQDDDHQPAVLQRAKDAFARFTHYRYRLAYDRQRGFRAHDAHTDAWRGPGELSTGTVAQLLLALRIGFTATAEQGRASLPLVLDEALTTADGDRFRAVADSVRAWAASAGRQVVYLTARDADAAYWRRHEGDGVGVTDVSRLRASQAAELDPERLRLPSRAPAPRPDGQAPEAYAVRLGVPPLDPWADPAAVHLFHPLRDHLELLPPLLDAGLERCGQARNALAVGRTLPGLETDGAQLVRGRLAATEAWIEAYRRGRGRPVTRADLRACDAVSDRYLDAVAELAEAVGGDAAELLQRLENRAVSNFRSAKRQQLADELHARGHLGEGDPCTPEERVARVHDALAGELGGGADRAREARAVCDALHAALPAAPPGAAPQEAELDA